METKKPRYAEIVEKVKQANPTASNSDLAKLISSEIKLGLPKPEPLVPMNTGKEITEEIRFFAKNVAQRRKGLLVQFVRPGQPKLIGANVNLQAGTINNIYSKQPPVGALVAFMNGIDIFIGWSKYNQAHEVVAFTKRDATLIGIMRALTDGLKPGPDGCYVTREGIAVPSIINKAVEPFASRAAAYFKCAVKNVDFV